VTAFDARLKVARRGEDQQPTSTSHLEKVLRTLAFVHYGAKVFFM